MHTHRHTHTPGGGSGPGGPSGGGPLRSLSHVGEPEPLSEWGPPIRSISPWPPGGSNGPRGTSSFDRKHTQLNLIQEVSCVCIGLRIPLGESLFGGPSSNVGGDRKALVSDAGRPRGEGPYGDLSPGCETGSEC